MNAVREHCREWADKYHAAFLRATRHFSANSLFSTSASR